jgi:glycogen(starch) synthase
VVGSAGGGLPEAIGPCGVTFPNGDIAALTDRLHSLLTDPDGIDRFRAGAKEHLARHTRAKMVDAYLRVLEGAVA